MPKKRGSTVQRVGFDSLMPVPVSASRNPLGRARKPGELSQAEMDRRIVAAEQMRAFNRRDAASVEPIPEEAED